MCQRNSRHLLIWLPVPLWGCISQINPHFTFSKQKKQNKIFFKFKYVLNIAWGILILKNYTKKIILCLPEVPVSLGNMYFVWQPCHCGLQALGSWAPLSAFAGWRPHLQHLWALCAWFLCFALQASSTVSESFGSLGIKNQLT